MTRQVTKPDLKFPIQSQELGSKRTAVSTKNLFYVSTDTSTNKGGEGGGSGGPEGRKLRPCQREKTARLTKSQS